MATRQTDAVVVGGGLAGIVTALELLRAGLHVTIIDRHPPERFGGLALWAFGGMAIVGTPLQKRHHIPDTPELALADWLRFGELDPTDRWPVAWAKHYVEHSRAGVWDWLTREGVRFMPAVNWVERGRHGDGNRLPRYHLVWGTSRGMTETLIKALREAGGAGKLTVLHRHRATAIDSHAGRVNGVIATNEVGGAEVRVEAPIVIVATGGLNGSHAEARKNWPADHPLPTEMLNGMHPFADGAMHHYVADHLGGLITHAGEMWNYAAGVPHPHPDFPGHGLSLIPCKSALWLDHTGRRIGPEPLVTAFDTHWLCQRVAAQEKPWTWQLMNRRIALKEFAISGSEYNLRIRQRQFVRFVLELLLGNRRLVDQMQRECPQFLVAATLPELTAKMNALAGSDDVAVETLQATVADFDANFAHGLTLHDDEQIRLILHARQWGPDRLRTCQPAPLAKPGAGPFIAIQTRLITRKSLGGLRTDLASRVLDAADQPIGGLYAVGEAAGFGGGGCSGKRSLEGTFLPGCLLTAHAAAADIAGKGRS